MLTAGISRILLQALRRRLWRTYDDDDGNITLTVAKLAPSVVTINMTIIAFIIVIVIRLSVYYTDYVDPIK